MAAIRRLSVLLAVLSSAAFAVHPQSGDPGRSTFQSPIIGSPYGLIFTNVKVEGRESLALIDTGSSRAVELSSRLAGKLDLQLIEDRASTITGHDGKPFYLKRGRAATITVGDHERRDAIVEVPGERVDGIARQVKVDFDVILGWQFWSGQYLIVDYRNALLRFGDRPINLGPARVSLQYAVVNHVPVLDGEMGGAPVKLLLDTGAPTCNIDAARAKAHTSEMVTREATLGGVRITTDWRVKDLSVIKRGLGCEGVIGNNLLSRYTVYFDTRAGVVYLHE